MRHWALTALFILAPALEAQSARVLAVPFAGSGELSNADWIGEGIAETIREVLLAGEIDCIGRDEREDAARQLGLAGPARSSVAAILKLAARLEARYAVFGEFEASAPENNSPASSTIVRIRARVVDVERLASTAEFQQEGSLGELARLAARLAAGVLCHLREETDCPAEFGEAVSPVRVDALESYTRGLISASAEQKHRLLAQAALLAPEFAAPRLELARMHLTEGGYRAAIRWLEQIPPSSPRHGEALFLLGLARYHTGDYRGAMEAFSTLAETAPSPAVWNNLGLALYRLGDPGGVEAVERAAGAEPSEADYHFNAGYLLWRRGDLAAARRRLEAAAALDPNDAQVRQLLERIELGQGPRRGDLSLENLERLKESAANGLAGR